MMRISLIAVPVFAAAGICFANGLGGQRLEKVVNNQIVDIGTDQASLPKAGAPIQFDFNLLKSDTREVLPSTNVDVNISHNGVIVLDSDLIMEPPLTLFVYAFPEAGDYTLKVTFYKQDQQLATASFPLAITESSSKMRPVYIGGIAVIILLGLLGAYWGGRRRRARAG